MFYTHSLTVDFNAVTKPPCVYAKQNDCGSRFLEITLLADGQPVSCGEAEIVLRCEKTDGTVIFNAVTVLSENRIQCALTSAMLSCAGLVRCEITLYESNSILSSGRFFIHVMPSIDDAAVESSNEFTELQKIMADYNAQIKNAASRKETVGVAALTAKTLSIIESSYEEVQNV